MLALTDFAGLVGDAFDVTGDGETARWTLAEAQALTTPTLPGAERAPFSLTFRSGSPVVREQQIRAFSHPAVGTVDIFVTPIAQEPDGIVYQAVFN